ncbi:P-loop containing nucleoside triphosphate hydrolase protein [Lepidopterella palustris CBS 459.81]|uniref:ATP-dependent DNA helicase n=1 Tax=Lepidopterella palustris CBS 459.81 TaxID=1314670 RepID=A0A8E2ECE9_9PEZI|nr:P-loop containing nucleoside triphosphate hydrolase protein [Lepidopterella palustris CBS 459.81]
MSEGDEFGDFDDEEILAVATQFENNAAFTFRPSPRPQKRRRVDLHHDEIQDDDSGIPARKSSRSGLGRQRVVLSDNEDASNTTPFAKSMTPAKQRNAPKPTQRSSSEEAFDPAPSTARFTPRRRQDPRPGQRSIDRESSQSKLANSTSCTGKQKKEPKPEEKENGDLERESESPSKKQPKKPKHRIHTLAKFVELKDIYFTHPPDIDSSPGNLGGPIRQKKSKPVASVTGVAGFSPAISRSMMNGVNVEHSLEKSNTTANGSTGPFRPFQAQNGNQQSQSVEDDDALPSTEGSLSNTNANIGIPPISRTNVDPLPSDIAKELADLPSDAFASSSSSPQKQTDDAISLSSQVSPVRRSNIMAPQTGLRQTTLFGRGGVESVPASQGNKRYNFSSSNNAEPPTHHKLDADAINTWVYPTNLGTIRDYQFNIVARGLFHNLLVALPTGLGKTFIAATIMLNWFRWTTDAQIIFVAPTKPLVSQQVEACFGIAGIPRSQTSMLTGGIAPGLRTEEYLRKRVFFMTPQTIMNDLKTGICDPKRIVLLVVDEAHRATGAYAYVEVVKFIRRFNESFRVLALTATPGADVEAVQKVIDGLDISRVEIRTEQSLDIRNYVHSRKIEKHVFENSEEMEMCMGLYSKAVQPVLAKLNSMNAYWSKDPLSLTPYGCTQARMKWMGSEAGRKAHWGVKSMVMNIFSILASLSHGMELLKYHGIGPFQQALVNFKNSSDEKNSKYKREITESEHFQKLIVRLHGWVNDDNFIGHPKLEFMQEIILEHFVNAGERGGSDDAPLSSTRIMVFAHFRDSAEEIVRVLRRHEPMIRPHVFVGQATSKNSEGMDQKRQLEIIHKFKTGVYNTLIATSIGEEGLDIGEVDLIICYDSKASPIRMLQRMGRTGRKRAGKIILLQMKGKEEDDAVKAKDNYEKMQEMIANGSRFNFHDERSRRIVPKEIQPVVDKRVVEIPLENSQLDLPEPKRRGRVPKRPPKKFHMPDGVRTGFVQASRMDDSGTEEVPRPRARKTTLKFSSKESVVLGPLEDVVLNAAEAKDLERRYQTVFDDSDAPMIGAPNFTSHPERQRTVSRTKAFPRPGRAATSMVKMLKRIHDVNIDRIEELRRNLHFSDLEADPTKTILVSDISDQEEVLPASPARNKPDQAHYRHTITPAGPKPRIAPRAQALCISDLVDERASSSPPPTDPRMRIHSQAITLGSDTEGTEPEGNEELDSELADFIADDDEAIEMVSSSLPAIDSSVSGGMVGDGDGGAVRTKKFYVEREAVSSEEDDELPDASTLVGKRKPATLEVIDTDEDEEPVTRQRKRARRVADEDDSE